VTTSIVKGITSAPWWNLEWKKRKNILLNETSGTNVVNGLTKINITGLSGDIQDCSKEIRIIYNSQGGQEIPFDVYDGDDSSWCYVGFRVNLSANEVNNADYFVYYNNSAASTPSYSVSTYSDITFYAQTAATDEGTPSNPSNIVGFADNTYADLYMSGGGGGYESVHGRDFINETPSGDIQKVNIRYRYEVPQMAGNWYLRYSVDNGISYSDAFSGTNTLSKVTSSWHEITTDYATLSWPELNKTRLQGRIYKPGGGVTSQMYLYWVEMNVTYLPTSEVTQTGLKSEVTLVANKTGSTGVDGFWTWNWSTSNYDEGNYTALSASTPSSKDDSYDYETFDILPDTTPPSITLISPEDYDERGSGNVNFTYEPYDINLDTCILYFGQDGLEANETESSPLNNQENTFENIYFDIGVFEWNVWCNDTEGNSGFADSNFTLNISAPDLVIEQDDIWFSDESRIEGTEITIYANVSNRGLSDAEESFVVQFFKGSVSSENQVGENQTIDYLASEENATVNESYTLEAGKNNIFAVANLDESLNETSYSNNQANNTIIVELYQYFYGNVSTDVILANAAGDKIIDYEDNPGFSGNIFVADADSNFVYNNLIAIGRNTIGDPSSDFDDIDTNLNTTSFTDSIKEIWGNGTNTPIETRNFTLASRTIEDVPIVNSTDNENFKTGILWDSSDDSGNLQYDASDDEDFVFIAELNPASVGKYGTYDYEIRVPALLRDYKSGTNKLSFYIEIT
jgi:hypothetical protein